MKFYLDENLSPRIAEALRQRAIDAISAYEVGKTGASDEDQLTFAASQQRCLVTKNRQHFFELSRRAIRNREPHAGIVICPRRFTGHEIGAISRALGRLHALYPDGLGQYDLVYLG